jgi:Putative phage tail protein
MHGKLNQASTRPTALGTMLQASTYGVTIPLIVGRIKASFIWIWAANLRIGGSGKKGKGKGKKSPPTYVENIDALLGYNPILNVLQIWNNGSRYALDFLSVDFEGLLGGEDFFPFYTIDDPNFYSIVGMTFICRGAGFLPAGAPITGTFNDFGAQGPVPWDMTGQEIPMWNATQPGPDPTNPSGFRFFPYTYRWKPSFGATFYLDADIGEKNLLVGKVRVYYSRKSSLLKHLTPLAKARMTFENQLGNGPEWAGAGAFASQQVIAPEYAGCGSPDIDLGTGGMLPSIVPEVQGSYSTYASGDADFVDMIETVVRSGVSHTGYSLSEIHRGVNCSEFPGPIQKNFYFQGDPGARDVPSHYCVTQGNILLVYARKRGGGGQTISDTLGNNWISLYEGEPNGDGSINVWYAIANASGDTTISLADYDDDGAIQFFEMGGVDTIDTYQMFSGVGNVHTGTIVTSNDPNTPAFVMAFLAAGGLNSPLGYYDKLWKTLIPESCTLYVSSQYKTVNFPGPVTVNDRVVFGPWSIFMIAFKNSDPPSYAKSLGNILDGDSLDLTRAQCRAFGLIGSICMDSQKKALDWLEDLGKCANAAYVWSGNTLKVIPRSEKSAANNGALYVAPTAPVFHFGPGDFIVDGDNPPVTFDASAQIGNDDKEDAPNILQIEHLDRNSDYNQVVTSEPDAASVALYGPHKASPQVLHMIVDPQVARRILLTQIRHNTQIAPNALSFKLKAHNIFYEAMDVGLIDVPSLGLLNYPIRLTSVPENDKFELECKAEPFIYGVHAPDLDVTATSPQPNPTLANINIDPGSVNTPIIFEPVPRLTASGIASELWLVVPSSNPSYGGCFVYVSTDGGASYSDQPIATILGNGTTGEVLANPTPIVLNNRGADVEYNVTAADNGSVLQFPTAANVAVSLPDPTTLPANFTLFIFYGSDITLHSVPPGTLTITPTVDLINGAADFVMPGTPPNINWVVKITVDGAAYVALGSGAIGAGNGAPGSSVFNFVAAVINGGGSVGWPPWPDPDSFNNLFLDLSESLGELLSYDVANEDNFTFPCYVSNDISPTPTVAAGPQSYDSPNLCIPFNVPFGPGGTEFGLSIVRLRGAWVIYAANGGAAGTVSYDALGPCGGGTSFTLNGGTPPIGCGSCYGADKVPAFIFMGPVDRGLGFNYEFENVTLGFTNSGPVVGRARVDIPNGALFGADVVSLNGVTWPGGGAYPLGGAAVLIEMQPEHPGNPSLFIFMGIGQSFMAAPAGWTYVASGNYIQCYSQVASHGDPPDSKYELMTYADANLTAPYKYELMATGGNKLRRSVYGAPTPGFGVNHSPGTRFAFLNPSGEGIAKIPLDPRWIGVMLYFKFLAFNDFLANPQSLSDAIPYTYTPTGTNGSGTSGSAGGGGTTPNPNNFNYTITGGQLTNPSSTTIDMAEAQAAFPTNSVNYNAREFAIPAPTEPTTYYVTIADPQFLGDTGSETNLVATAQTSNALVGVAGNTYIGAITVLPAGGGTGTSPGGAPTGGSGGEQIFVNGV